MAVGKAVRALIFDFIGTLVNVVGYSHDDSLGAMYRSLLRDGLRVDFESFRGAYEAAWKRYRLIRYQRLVEVTNAVWLAEALNSLGFKASPDDDAVKKAVNAYFRGYLRAIRPRSCAQQTLSRLAERHKLGLISNFTHAPVIYAALRKVKLNQYFNVVLVSQAVGWRKPSPRIFRLALQRLGVEPEEAIFIGDNPKEDIEGARNVGMRAFFVPSQFFTTEDLREASTAIDVVVVKDLCRFPLLNKPAAQRRWRG